MDFSINFCVFAHFACLEGAYVGPAPCYVSRESGGGGGGVFVVVPIKFIVGVRYALITPQCYDLRVHSKIVFDFVTCKNGRRSGIFGAQRHIYTKVIANNSYSSDGMLRGFDLAMVGGLHSMQLQHAAIVTRRIFNRPAGRCLQLVRPIRGKAGSKRGLLSSRALIRSPEKIPLLTFVVKSQRNNLIEVQLTQKHVIMLIKTVGYRHCILVKGFKVGLNNLESGVP